MKNSTMFRASLAESAYVGSIAEAPMAMHAYNRRLEATPPKLPKCLLVVVPKLTSCAVVQVGVCVHWTIDLTLVSLSAMSANRLSRYVKDNDVRYGLKVAHHDPKSSKVAGLQCRFCIAFGREEKVGLRSKVATTVQGWSHPFHYDDIENHLRNQHSSEWALYQALKSSSKCAIFFDDVPVVFKNTIKVYFPSSSLGAELQIVYDIKDIVDTIVGDMMFNPEDQDDSDANNDADEEPAFGSAAELYALLLEYDGVLWCRRKAFSWNQYYRVKLFDLALGEGFVPHAFIRLWIRRSHAGKTILVHRAVPTLINANQSISA